jgi:hypothetical protein
MKLPDAERRQSLVAELLSLDFPWPDYLENKSLSWLDAELRALKSLALTPGRDDTSPWPR